MTETILFDNFFAPYKAGDIVVSLHPTEPGQPLRTWLASVSGGSVSSVNGHTGAVVLTPADLSGFNTAAAAAAPVQQVAGRTGSVTISHSDISDWASATAGFGAGSTGVTNFNGRTGNVTLSQSDVTTALGYTPLQTAPVTSVAGRGGAVTLAVADVSGAEATAHKGAAGGYVALDSNSNVLVPTGGGITGQNFSINNAGTISGQKLNIAAPIQDITGTVSDPVITQILNVLQNAGLSVNATSSAGTTSGGGSTGGGSTGGSGTGTSGSGTPAMRAATATDKLGVHVHCEYNSQWGGAAASTIYADLSKVQLQLAFLNPAGPGKGGLGVLRDDAHYMNGTLAGTNFQTLLNLGYKGMPFHGYDAGTSDYDYVYNTIQGLGANVVAWEGVLEPDNTGWGMVTLGIGVKLDYNGVVYSTSWENVAAAQINMADKTIRAGVVIDLLTCSLATPSNGAVGNALTNSLASLGQTPGTVCNVGNTHYYQHWGAAPYGPQYGEMDGTLATESAYTDAYNLPRAVTEMGYLDMGDNNAQTYNMPGNEDTVALYMPWTALHAMRLSNVKYCIFYELDDTPNVNAQAEENHFGIFRGDGSAKKVAISLHDTLIHFADGGATRRTFTPPNVSFTLAGGLVDAFTLTVARSDGKIIWTAWKDYNIFINGITTPAPASVSSTVTFSQTCTSIARYDPMARCSTYAGTAVGSLPGIPAPTPAQTYTNTASATFNFNGSTVILVITP